MVRNRRYRSLSDGIGRHPTISDDIVCYLNLCPKLSDPEDLKRWIIRHLE
ncbi:hypothetical protein [Paenibacillus odorifer]|nr:hypothetical protein [Paenibacillus odorifer]